MEAADAACRAAVFERDRRCVACGAESGLQWAHILSRRYLQVRWDPRNSVVLCVRCHVYYTHRPLEWERWASDRLGAGTLAILKDRALRGTVGLAALTTPWLARAFVEDSA
jgi:hypothetical protein